MEEEKEQIEVEESKVENLFKGKSQIEAICEIMGISPEVYD